MTVPPFAMVPPSPQAFDERVVKLPAAGVVPPIAGGVVKVDCACFPCGDYGVEKSHAVVCARERIKFRFVNKFLRLARMMATGRAALAMTKCARAGSGG